MADVIWLEEHERARFAAYLRQEADTEEQMAGLTESVGAVGPALAKHRRQTATILRLAADYVGKWESMEVKRPIPEQDEPR